ncbi:MAG: hypothetical protein CMK74_01110 [Pseudomonadales bacterium]|nr:hypothetical protein [Pseudomonadales bacterium]
MIYRPGKWNNQRIHAFRNGAAERAFCGALRVSAEVARPEVLCHNCKRRMSHEALSAEVS